MLDNEKLLETNSLTDLDIDLADNIISIILEEDYNIPLVKTAIAIYKTGKGISEYLFAVKLQKFLQECKNIDKEKQQAFITKNVEGKEKRVGLNFIQLLSNLDEVEKATIVGKVYKYCVENGLNIKFYLRICYLVNECYYDDILELKHFRTNDRISSKNKVMDTETLVSLYAAGLLSEYGYNGGGFTDEDDEGTIFGLNKYSEIIVDLM